ncbi:MAG TPA: V-type ATP synthase subunit F [Candidatus Thermoplasmatota archaeon]|nr:V-type ATP synthase subunit F [Candidatus Thermoplasmatota archaeon]
MSGLGVVGHADFARGFRLAGIRKVWEAATEEELERAVVAARRDADVAILVLATRDLARLHPRTRSELVASVRPTVVAVGNEEDNALRDKIKQAVGVDLW